MSGLLVEVDGNPFILSPTKPWSFAPAQGENGTMPAAVPFRLRYSTHWTLHLPGAGTTVALDGEDLGAPATVLLRRLDEGHVVHLRQADRACVVALRSASGTGLTRSSTPVAPAPVERMSMSVGHEPVFIGRRGGGADLELSDERLGARHVRVARTRDGLRISQRSTPDLLLFDGAPVSVLHLAAGERFHLGRHELEVTADGVRVCGDPPFPASVELSGQPSAALPAAPEPYTRPATQEHDEIATDFKLTVRLGSVEHDLDVHLHHPAATVGDVLHAIGAPVPGQMYDGTRAIPTSTTLLDAALPEAAALSTTPTPSKVVRAVADRPFGLDIHHQLTGTNTVPFNRPPRRGRTRAPAPLVPPGRKPPAPPAQFGWALLIGGLLIAALTVAVTQDLRFAVLTGVSPLLSVGTYFEQRRRQKKTDRRNEAEFLAAVTAFDERIAAEGAAERDHRREIYPDPREMLRRAAVPSRLLWERRPDADDYLALHAGTGTVRWAPPLADSSPRIEPEVETLLSDCRIDETPVHIVLADAGVVGIVGDRRGALAVARSLLLQAAVQTGPADLTVAAFVDPDRQADWEWVKWLPHSRRAQTSTSGRWTSAERRRSNRMLRALPREAATSSALLLVDSGTLLEGRISPARKALGLTLLENAVPVIQISGIVVAESADRLPAVCTTVVSVREDGTADVTYVRKDVTVDGIAAAGITAASAVQGARDIARFDDPERSVVGGGLPDLVRLLPLLELDQLDGRSIQRRWTDAARQPGLRFPLGLTEQGVFDLDLVRDGPHGLVAGMTGSGKSEFLRSLILSLAATYDTTRLNLILVDFKGGAAFDGLTVPHVVGRVTNLNEQLANRALRALEAELHNRERKFADAGVDNVDDYREACPDEPLPRLLIVVDEFAMLAKEYPDVLTSLISVAVIGRTLGVHLLLATQRPAGVVSDDITANTNLRVALQVRSVEDSTEVIDSPEASTISRHLRGRAFVRLGHDELVPIQTALVTTASRSEAQAPLDARPFTFDGDTVERRDEATDDADSRELDSGRLVRAIAAAHEMSGQPAPREVWPEALGARIPLQEVASLDERLLLFAKADDPEKQTQYPVGWDLGEGNLLLVGLPGSGLTSTLATVGLTLAAALPPDELELVVLDVGAGDLAALKPLPHTSSVVLAGERRRQLLLLEHLQEELRLRRARRRTGTLQNRTVVLIDNFAALVAELDDGRGVDALQSFYQVFRDGPQVGLSFAVSADRLQTLPGQIANVVVQKWLFRAADRYDYSLAGVPPSMAPPPIPGRAVLAATGLHAQVGLLSRPLPEEVDRVALLHGLTAGGRERIKELPEELRVDELQPVAVCDSAQWIIPVGVSEAGRPVELTLHEGDHALVTGAPRSGKSTTLATIATALRRGSETSGRPVLIVATGSGRSPLSTHPDVDRFFPEDIGGLLAEVYGMEGFVALLIDDAHTIGDNDALATFLRRKTTGLHVFAAARGADLRSVQWIDWLKRIRQSRSGVLLQPDLINGDDNLLGITLRAEQDVRLLKGRGYVVNDGDPVLAQMAM